jgi:serine/threonine protein kinase
MAKIGDRLLGRFAVSGVVSSGEESSTYLADDTENGKVVVREFPIEALDSWDTLGKFEKRAAQYSELTCESFPQFVGFYSDDASDDPAVYFVYEEVAGVSLEQEVETNGAFSDQDTVVMLQNILDGLTRLHQQSPQIVHGAIRPNTIVKSSKGTYRLKELPFPEMPPAYSPGQEEHVEYAPRGGRRDTRFDLYGLGMSAIFAKTGKHPAGQSGGYRTGHGALNRAITSMVGSTGASEVPSALEVLAWLTTPDRMEEKEIPDETRITHPVEILSSASRDTVNVYNPDSSRPESLLIGFFLDLWASKPWLIILIAAVLSAGPIAIPLIIFFYHPKSRILLNRAFAKYRDVFLTLGRRSLTVSDQVKQVDYSDIESFQINENASATGIQLETVLQLSNRKEVRFYINSLSRGGVRKISRLINTRRTRG